MRPAIARALAAMAEAEPVIIRAAQKDIVHRNAARRKVRGSPTGSRSSASHSVLRRRLPSAKAWQPPGPPHRCTGLSSGRGSIRSAVTREHLQWIAINLLQNCHVET